MPLPSFLRLRRDPHAGGPKLTQAQSRGLGRALLVVSVITLVNVVRSTARRRSLAALLLAPGVAMLALLGVWGGYTLSVMNWDDPADYRD